jgi:hypothetical protein
MLYSALEIILCVFAAYSMSSFLPLHIISYTGFEVHITVVTKSSVFWVITLSGPLNVNGLHSILSEKIELFTSYIFCNLPFINFVLILFLVKDLGW